MSEKEWPPKAEDYSIVAYGTGPDGEMVELPAGTVTIGRVSFQEYRYVDGVEHARAGYYDDDGNEVVTHPWAPPP